MQQSVLCVDDDRNLCQIIAKALTSEGYCVRTAHDGEEALASFREQTPDLVMLDLLLPKRDGFGVLQQIRAMGGKAGDVPALFVSGCSSTPEYKERADALGAAGFLTKPVPLDLLLGKVRKELGGASAVAAVGTPPATKLSGSLAEMPFPALLHQLHGLRASGALLLRHGKKRKGLQIKDGRPVAVKSNLVSECLGNLLVRMGRIDQPALQESLTRMKQGEGLQGEILVAMEVLSEDELMNALRVQAEEKLFEVFEWADGSFELKRGGRLKGASSLSLERSPANIIMEGVRHRFPIERIDAWLKENADSVIVGGEIPFYQFQEVDLGETTQSLLDRMDQQPRVSEALTGDEVSRRMLYGMLAAQVIELRRDPGSGHEHATTDPAAAARARLAAARSAQPDPREDNVREQLASMAERMRGKNFFDVLGVSQDADDEDVRSVYVQLAKRTHPDRFSGYGEAVKRLAEEIFGLVSQAHENLSDRKRRENYRLELLQGEREAEALEEGRRALSAEQHFQKGEAALRAKQYDPAYQSFRQAAELYPEEGEYLAYLGWTRFLTAENDATAREEAVRALRRAAKLAPDSEKPFLLLGQLFKAIGRADNAERMFVKAVQLKSDCVEALRELRLINLRREKQKGLVRKLLRR